MLGPVLFLIYINDLPDDITPLCNIFENDTSLFSKVHNINKSVNELNPDSEKISQWVYQSKVQFNSDLSKHANEFVFSRKSNSVNFFYPLSNFNSNDIGKCPYQKHLGTVLDSKLNFNSHVDQKIFLNVTN